MTQPRLRSYACNALSNSRSVKLKNRPCFSSWVCALSSRLHSIGVSVNATRPDTRIATLIVIANSRKSRPMIPPMNISGMNTAESESIIDNTVKPTSSAPSSDAWRGDFPISRCRTMFSSITIASSTTNPTANVNAINDKLSMLKSSAYITEKVPMMAIGSVRLGMTVATALRRKKKITATTSTSATSNDIFTSATALLIVIDRSYCRCTLSVGGKPCSISESASFTRRATSTVFVPGWRCTIRLMARSLSNQLTLLLFWMSSSTFATSPSRTAPPLRYADDKPTKLVGVVHLASRLNRERLVLSVQHARRQHHVVVADCRGHLRHADVAARQLRRIHLHAHGILRGSEHTDGSDAFDD